MVFPIQLSKAPPCFLEDLNCEISTSVETSKSNESCPSCGAEIIRNGRCLICSECFWSTCEL